jgi:hypothetical protein
VRLKLLRVSRSSGRQTGHHGQPMYGYKRLDIWRLTVVCLKTPTKLDQWLHRAHCRCRTEHLVGVRASIDHSERFAIARGGYCSHQTTQTRPSSLTACSQCQHLAEFLDACRDSCHEWESLGHFAESHSCPQLGNIWLWDSALEKTPLRFQSLASIMAAQLGQGSKFLHKLCGQTSQPGMGERIRW